MDTPIRFFGLFGTGWIVPVGSGIQISSFSSRVPLVKRLIGRGLADGEVGPRGAPSILERRAMLDAADNPHPIFVRVERGEYGGLGFVAETQEFLVITRRAFVWSPVPWYAPNAQNIAQLPAIVFGIQDEHWGLDVRISVVGKNAMPLIFCRIRSNAILIHLP